MKTNDHPFGFIDNGGKSCVLDFIEFTITATESAIAIQVFTFTEIVRAGSGVTDAKAGGVFNDQPGVE